MSTLRVNSHEEPWRYACPDCGSIQVRRLVSGTRRKDREYPASGRGVAMAEQDRRLKFRCRQCRERIPFVIDRKTDTRVRA